MDRRELESKKRKLKLRINDKFKELGLDKKHKNIFEFIGKEINDLYEVNSFNDHTESPLIFLNVNYVIHPKVQDEFDEMFHELKKIMHEEISSI